MISEKMHQLGSKRSVIREIFEYGKKRKAEIGADNVFDFSLGNPSVPAPACVNETIIELLNTQDPILLHGYTSAQGDLSVRKTIADYISEKYEASVEADDIFSAVVSVAGMMPENIWVDKPGQCKIGILQITGEKDDVVPKNRDGSAKFSKAPAIEEVMKYYVEKNGLSLSDTVSIGKKSILEKYISSDSKKQVWNIFIPDGRHSWPDESIVGFSTNQMILDLHSELMLA